MQLQTKDWVTEREQWKEDHSLVLTYSSLRDQASSENASVGLSERALALSCIRWTGLGVARRRGASAVKMAGMVRTRKVEGWSGGTGGAVRAQHDAIRAGTRRSLRSERRDASAESIAWIARQVIADARGVPLYVAYYADGVQWR